MPKHTSPCWILETQEPFPQGNFTNTTRHAYVCLFMSSLNMQEYLDSNHFGPMMDDSVKKIRHFAFWRHGIKLAIFLNIFGNSIVQDASLELTLNLATLIPKKLQSFYGTLLHHCYTLHTTSTRQTDCPSGFSQSRKIACGALYFIKNPCLWGILF